jgi:hypothetical protein
LFKAQALDTNAIFQQLKGELLNKGMAVTDIGAVEQPVKSMLSLGASQLDVKNILLDLVVKGFKGTDLGSLVGMVSDLMKSGGSTKLSADVVTQAIQQAGALGLKGKELLAQVGSVVNLKKASLNQLKGGTDSAKNSLGSIFGK